MKDLFDLLAPSEQGSLTESKADKPLVKKRKSQKKTTHTHASSDNHKSAPLQEVTENVNKKKKLTEEIKNYSTQNPQKEEPNIIDASLPSISDNIMCYSVSELSRIIRSEIEERFHFVKIRGELGRISQPASGHIYLDIKDENAVMAGVIWKNKAHAYHTIIEQGLEVVITGSLTTFAPQSRYQITIDHIEPAGKGALMALLEQRRIKLQKEGIFDAKHKQNLPYLPKKIGVITSLQGAVIQDIRHRLRERFPRHVIVYPALMQGEYTAEQVISGIKFFNQLPCIEKPDIIIIARGGGSIEDLWAFNEESLVYAAKDSAIPIISAIGHETDWCLLDYVADYRAPTPTAAAEKSVPVRQDLYHYLALQDAQLIRIISTLIKQKKQQYMYVLKGLVSPKKRLAQDRQRLDYVNLELDSLFRHKIEHKHIQIQEFTNLVSYKKIKNRIDFHTYKLDSFMKNLDSLINNYLKACRANVEHNGKQLHHLGYPNILKRGFALISDEKDKTIIRSSSEMKDNQTVDICFYDSHAKAKILTKHHKNH